jgi:fumarate reductase iron-sulfur subunit
MSNINATSATAVTTATTAATQRHIEIQCQRFDPEADTEPHWQTYNVPFNDEMSVLQGLQHIKDHLDGSLTFRWSCRIRDRSVSPSA